MERISLGFDINTEEILSKTSFLSYHIATYNAVNGELGMADGPVTVDEIFDYINDLKHEGVVTDMPSITKLDVLLTFRLLLKTGLGKQTTNNLAILSN
ncbi:hypothetical protein [Candidatus Nitrosotalea okcheonensis]|nr:hypothetical protein [Candidatus Nitrosotalea okcheonensis]